MVKIIQRLIPKTNKATRPGIRMSPRYITIHETDNTSPGADADAHARLQLRGNNRTASWHLQIDDTQAIQSIPFNEVAWAAGDGNGPGNMSSVHVEMCVNRDGNYRKTVENTAEVVKYLMAQLNIPLTNVVQHNRWTGKNCPRYLRSGEKGINWGDFISMLRGPSKVSAVKSVDSNAVLWDGMVLKKGQIGRITILKPINLWKRNANDELQMVRILQPGEVYRVYGYDEKHGGQYNVGADHWITKMDGYIKYETPSKEKLRRANR